MIQHVLIQDYEEKYGPPEGFLLSVAVTDELVFLRIGKYEETHKEAKFAISDNEDNQIAVPLIQLLNAIITCQSGEVEDDVRKKVEEARSAEARK